MKALEIRHEAMELLAGLEPELLEVVEASARLEPGSYLVGGVIRDLLLGHTSRDVDIVAETPARAVTRALQRHLGGKLTCHDAFLTCSLELPVLTLDVATTRSEHYPRPGALPVVQPSDLAHDLYRRDFSVNTFALKPSEPHTLLSVKGARDDLATRTLRILHERSFFDDPTRIVRGARLAGRLAFAYDAQTEGALQQALTAEVYQRVSPARFKNELLLTLAEPRVAPALNRLAASGALTALYDLHNTPLLAKLDALKASLSVPVESYLLALLLALSEAEAAAHVRKFNWPRRLLAARTRLLTGDRPPRSDAERVARQALQPERFTEHPQIRGSDVLSLGLSAGPDVGRVLEAVAQARSSGQVASFAAELELAKRLVHDILKQEKV